MQEYDPQTGSTYSMHKNIDEARLSEIITVLRSTLRTPTITRNPEVIWEEQRCYLSLEKSSNWSLTQIPKIVLPV